MVLPNPGSESREIIAAVWRRTLQDTPTTFGRLAYLSDLRDGATGRYSHAALAPVANADEMDRALRQSHHQVFWEWLNFTLAEQKSDLSDFLRNSKDGRISSYRQMIPPGAREVEKQLFISDLELMLQLLDMEASD